MVKGQKLNDEMISTILFLRFGDSLQTRQPRHFTSYSAIARMLKVDVNTIRNYCLKAVQSCARDSSLKDSGNKQDDAENEFFLQQNHINFLTKESTLKLWVTRSIKERCVLFHRQFPDKFIKPWRLRYIYKQNLIKQKAINIAKMPIKSKDGRY